MATYDNDLRLKEITTGDEDGTWGVSTNTNLALIADGFSLGTKEMAADANETFTMPDATADATRSLYLKITSAVSLTATREVTLGPNTVSKTWIIENATSGSQIITIKQGSGATVNVANGSKVIIVTDGAGAGAAVFNANPTELDSVALSSVLATGNTTGGTDLAVSTGDDITFADSSKAIFGAGNDLEIYHDGSNSYITDVGTGNLYVQGANLWLTKTDGTVFFGGVDSSGEVRLYHNGNQKLNTTSTGIDVTGTSAADYLTTESQNPTLNFIETDTTDLNTRLRVAASNFQVHTIDDSYSSEKTRLLISNTTGDISFYEDTGTTPKFFWDASTERLGIGNATPATALDVTGTVTADGLTVNADALINSVTVGRGAGDVSTNTTVGNLALAANTSGANNVANGYVALRKNTTGSNNTATGSLALYENTTGNSNVATGYQALYDNTDGDNNIATGYAALSNNTTGSNNVATGYIALLSNTTGSNNTALGRSAGNSLTTGSNNTVIGYNADASSATVSNETTIGNTSVTSTRIFGDISFYEDTGTTPKFFWDASAERLGIGNSSPATTLDVNGTVTAEGLTVDGTTATIQDDSANLRFENSAGTRTGYIQNRADAFDIWDDQATPMIFGTSNAERMRIDSSGNVGIGNTSPETYDGIASTTALVVGGTSGNNGVNVVSGATSSGSYMFSDSGGNDRGGLAYYHTADLMTISTAGAERMRIDSSGALLIHPNSPTRGLKITSTQTVAVGDTETYNAIGAGYGQHIFQTDSTERLRLANNGDISFYEDTGTTPKFFWDASAEMLAVGTTNTGSTAGTALRLEKAGSTRLNIVAANASYSAIDFGDAQDLDVGKIEYYHANNTMYFTTNATNRMVIDSSGNVGIGDTNPILYNALGSARQLVVGSSGGSTVTITSGTSSYGHLAFATGTATDSDEYRGLIQYYHADNSMSLYTNATQKLRIDSSGNVNIYGTDNRPLAITSFNTASAGAGWDLDATSISGVVTVSTNGAERLRITSSGNVGIGTTSPDYKLHVYNSTALDHISIDGPAGINRNLNFSTAGSTRWNIYANATAEGGSNSGSNLTIARYTDAGAYNGC